MWAHFFFFPLPFLPPSPCWRLWSLPPIFWVLVFSLGMVSAAYSITDLPKNTERDQCMPTLLRTSAQFSKLETSAPLQFSVNVHTKSRSSASFPSVARHLWKTLPNLFFFLILKSAGLIEVTEDWNGHIIWQSLKYLHSSCYFFPSTLNGLKYLGQNGQAKATSIFRKALLSSSRNVVLNHLLLTNSTPMLLYTQYSSWFLTYLLLQR